MPTNVHEIGGFGEVAESRFFSKLVIDSKSLKSDAPNTEEISIESYPWPYDDESVSEIKIIDGIQFINDIIKFMEECYRVLTRNGRVEISCPYYTHQNAWDNPFIKFRVTENSFNYFDKQWVEVNAVHTPKMNCNFKLIHKRYYAEEEYTSRSNAAKEWAKKNYLNAISRMDFVLGVKK